MEVSCIKKCFNDLETKNFLLFYLLCRCRFKYFSKKDIEKYQKRRTEGMVKYAVNYSNFFKKYYSRYDLKTFKSLPTVNKKVMMENLTEYNTVGLTKEEILKFCLEVEESRDFSRRLKGMNIGMSSGTSGNKGVEIVTQQEEMYTKAALLARFDFPKGEKINLAFILRVSTPAFNLDILGHKLTYISQLQPIEAIVEQLSELQPNVISGPPSMLKIIAKEVEEGRLNIAPKRVVSYAEVLYPDVREYLSKIFNCVVHEIYKCTEGAIALSCKYGNLHINEDLVYVETLNNDGTETPVGKPCQKLIVTDLHKKSQPIIRYELNDIITISPKRCKCGSSFRVIEKIQGRADDVFWAKILNSGKWQYIFPDYISRAVISSSEDIEEYQVIQKSPEVVLVRLQIKKNVNFNQKILIQSMEDVFRKYNCKIPKIIVEFKRPEVNKNSRKLIRIHREFKLKNNRYAK